MTDKICSVLNCDKPIERRSWCNAHYRRLIRHGDPLGGGTSKGARKRFVDDVALQYRGNDCLLWPFGHNGNGYARMDGDYVHRLVCEKENGPPPTPEHEAAHSCGNGKNGCITRRHLGWKTHAQNMADTLVHGTHNRGERCGTSRLTEDQVREIRALRGKIPQVAIAEMFGVSRTAISSIHTGANWGWLEAAE